MEHGLRQALRKQEFELAFHAEIDIASGRPVETQEQLDFLRGEGCDRYQGYLADAQVQAGPLGKLLA